MKKADLPLTLVQTERGRSPEEKLVIGVLVSQIKSYMAAKEIGDDFDQMRRNVKAMIHHHLEKKFHWQTYCMNLIGKFQDQEVDEGVVYSFLAGVDHYFKALTAIYRYRRKYKMLGHGSLAEAYIFDTNRDMEKDIFGFAHVCGMLELDVTKFRDRLRKLDREQIKKIKDTLREDA